GDALSPQGVFAGVFWGAAATAPLFMHGPFASAPQTSDQSRPRPKPSGASSTQSASETCRFATSGAVATPERRRHAHANRRATGPLRVSFCWVALAACGPRLRHEADAKA